uniref:AMP-binding domain-containing protein n=1 Tax=Macrostomum lignano TaxID=282301 RepID=A0A1I8FBH7_9PLAT
RLAVPHPWRPCRQREGKSKFRPSSFVIGNREVDRDKDTGNGDAAPLRQPMLPLYITVETLIVARALGKHKLNQKQLAACVRSDGLLCIGSPQAHACLLCFFGNLPIAAFYINNANY